MLNKDNKNIFTKIDALLISRNKLLYSLIQMQFMIVIRVQFIFA